MSGGFFRGTSADQDTRFSNKQAKLLKSQKFPPELDHLVDMTKVKMDVIRPWIATRVTELLGFEDEVLINFVYGLLEAKEVDGKKIQIQLTGFMEKNTGKFMKELWGLLLSAQNNVSGVPQQFLDAKEEETKKKKAETDRIAQEIQKRIDRDGREPERERKSRFDGEADGSKFSKFSGPRDSDGQPEADREVDGRHASRAKNGQLRSSPSNDRSPSPRIVPSPTRSTNKSISGSRSYSEERRKSGSLSVSSQSLRRSVSPKRRYQSPERQSLSPTRRYRPSLRRSISPHRRQSPQRIRSPVRRRSPHPRRRSRSRHRSPSPYRYRSPRARRRSPRRISRSPLRRRSPSPLWRRSPSPFRRRSPARRRSSPRHRSPSPSRHRSPLKARRRSPSPVRRRSPIKNRSLSPERVRSPFPGRRSPPSRSPRRRQGSPFRSPKNHPADSPTSPPQRKRSPSPHRSRSPSRRSRRSLSREHDGRANGIKSRRYQEEQFSGRTAAKDSPGNHSSERVLSERPGSKYKPLSHRVPISLRSPQRGAGNQSGSCKKMSVLSPENSPRNSESPTGMQKLNPRARRRSPSLSKSPVRQTNIKVPQHDSPRKSKEHITRAREVSRHRTDSSRRSKDSPKELSPESSSLDRREFSRSPASPGSPPHSELKKKDSRRESDRQRPVKLRKSDLPSDKTECEQVVGDEMRDQQGGDENNELYHETGSTTRSKRKMDKKMRDIRDSDSEDTSSFKNENPEKRRHKKSDKRKRDYDETSGSDSQIEGKKKSKRRRKDEKRLRKEERRRRREERHLRKLERRAVKMKVKSVDTVSPPPDVEMNRDDSGDSDPGASRPKNLHLSDADENESEQKRLEIELREKPLNLSEQRRLSLKWINADFLSCADASYVLLLDFSDENIDN